MKSINDFCKVQKSWEITFTSNIVSNTVCFPYLQIVRHGGALGLGLAALGTARQDVYDLLKSNLYQDDAVTGMQMSTEF